MKKVMIYLATLVTAFGLAVAMNVTNVSAGVGPVKPPVVKPTPKPVPEEPTTEEPTPVEPTTEEPRPEEPTTEEPRPEEPTTEEPRPEEPTTEEPTPVEATTEETVTEELVSEKAEDPSEGDTAKKTKKSTSVPTGDPVAAMEAGFILLSSASGLVVLRKRR